MGDSESFGALLRRHRRGAGLTQDLSALAGLGVRTISSLESGHTARPYRHSVQLIAEALALPAEPRAELFRAARRGAIGQADLSLLSDDGRPAGQLEGGQPQAAAPPVIVPPAQLPPDIVEFTGRDEHASWLAELLIAPGARPVRIAATTGAGGVGKSALAIHVAHRISSAFPDGQLFVNLRGSAAQPVSTGEALARFLRQLGVADADMPAEVEERAAEFRTRLADLAMLIVLDDARDAAQVRMLLPGTATSAVLVTSRNWLADLEGSRVLALGPLDEADARRLFSNICGSERVAAEPTATQDVLAACGGLPLAIRIAAARLVSRPTWAISVLADLLRNELRRLEVLAVGDLAVRASFQVSYDALRRLPGPGSDVSRAFRLLGRWPGSDISLAAATALLGVDPAAAAEMLERLIDFQLLEAPSGHRYRFHDLIRAFAAELAEPAGSQAQAVSRILLWYTHTAVQAVTSLEVPPTRAMTIEPAGPGVLPLTFGDYDAAAQWCDAERANLVAAATLAARSGRHVILTQLAEVLWQSFLRSPWDGWTEVFELGIASAASTEDLAAQAWLANHLGTALILRGRSQDGILHLEESLALSQVAGDRQCERSVTNNLAVACRELKRFDDAIGYLQHSLALDRRPQHHGWNLINLGETYIATGRPEDAARSFEEGLALLGSAGVRKGESIGRALLANAYRLLGRPDEAISSAELSLKVSQDLHDDYNEAGAWYMLGQALADSGQLDRARHCLDRAFALAERLGTPDAEQIAASIAALERRD